MSVFLFPLLFLIEGVTNRFYLSAPILWAAPFALPVGLSWLALVWVLVLLRKAAHANGWILAGAGLLMEFAAERYTDEMVGVLAGPNHSTTLAKLFPWGYIAAALALIAVGVAAALARRGTRVQGA